jgi:hypothetical protein
MARVPHAASWQLAIAELDRVLEEARAVAKRAEASLIRLLRDSTPANSDAARRDSDGSDQ